MLLHAWGLHGAGCSCGCDSGHEASRLLEDARSILKDLEESGQYDGFGLLKIVRASTKEDNLILDGREIPLLRQQSEASGCHSLVDYVNPEEDFIGVFMTGAGGYINMLRQRYEQEGDSYRALLLQSLADRLAEASSELMHYLTRREYWGYSPLEEMDIEKMLRGEYQGIRPAMGYPMLPDQLLNKEIFEILEPESSNMVTLTENGAMSPSSTVSGLYIANPKAKYFIIGRIGEDQMEDYANRRGLSIERISEILRQ